MNYSNYNGYRQQQPVAPAAAGAQTVSVGVRRTIEAHVAQEHSVPRLIQLDSLMVVREELASNDHVTSTPGMSLLNPPFVGPSRASDDATVPTEREEESIASLYVAQRELCSAEDKHANNSNIEHVASHGPRR